MLARVRAAAVPGVKAFPVLVEADRQSGLPSFSTGGLPDEAVRESRDRVRSAIVNSGFPFPAARVTVNLAPADLRKEGSYFDLAMMCAVRNSPAGPGDGGCRRAQSALRRPAGVGQDAADTLPAGNPAAALVRRSARDDQNSLGGRACVSREAPRAPVLDRFDCT